MNKLKRIERIISIMLCLSIAFNSIVIHAFAASKVNSEESVTVVLGNGEPMTYTFSNVNGDVIIAGYNAEGNLVERSILKADREEVVQEVADSVYDGTVYKISEVVSIDCSGAPLDVSPNAQAASNGVWTEPPLFNDAGLSASSVFPGYKYLGSTQPDSTYGVAVSVHRKMSVSEGEAYRFDVTAGTTVGTLASIIAGVAFNLTPEGILTTIAISLAASFIGEGVNCAAQGKLSYRQFHYTFKFNCNGSRDYSYKCCECRQWWVIYKNGKEVGLAEKSMMALNHINLELIERCRLALSEYVNGTKATVSCPLAAP